MSGKESWWERQSPSERATYIVGALAGVLTLAGAVIQGLFPVLLEAHSQLVVYFALGLGATLGLCLLAVPVFRWRHRTRAIDASKRRAADTASVLPYDIFISAPMNALDHAEYVRQRHEVLQLLSVLEHQCGFACYYSGRSRQNAQDFEAVDIGLDNDFRALRESRFFMMLYPATIASSVLVEAGMAIALRKPSVYFYAADAKLPFVLEGATNWGDPKFPRIRRYRYESFADLIRQLELNGKAIFRSFDIETGSIR